MEANKKADLLIGRHVGGRLVKAIGGFGPQSGVRLDFVDGNPSQWVSFDELDELIETLRAQPLGDAYHSVRHWDVIDDGLAMLHFVNGDAIYCDLADICAAVPYLDGSGFVAVRDLGDVPDIGEPFLWALVPVDMAKDIEAALAIEGRTGQ